MNTYLVIMVTTLVLTQIIRITQNSIILTKQKKKLDLEIKRLQQIRLIDLETQKKAFRLIVERLEREVQANKRD